MSDQPTPLTDEQWEKSITVPAQWYPAACEMRDFARRLESVARQLEHALWQLSRGMSEGEDTHPLVPASQVRDAREALAAWRELHTR